MPKRTKAIKKTDLKGNKAWLKKINTSFYQIETVDPNKTVLIVCEGQTEKLYFESFPVLSLTVEAINLEGQSKSKLVEITAEILETSQYDIVWCVFDMDVRAGANEFADFDNAINQAVNTGYNVAYSNDAFELWFYLHYHHTDQQHHRTFYYEKLSDFWGINYVKDGKRYDFCCQTYTLLLKDPKSSQEDAISRAKKLFEDQEDLVYHYQNPVTKVFELVEYLNSNLRQ